VSCLTHGERDVFAQSVSFHTMLNMSGVRSDAGKDVYWYTREKKQEGDDLNDELQAVKQREDQLMAEVRPAPCNCSTVVFV
jgi:hypothetical protein